MRTLLVWLVGMSLAITALVSASPPVNACSGRPAATPTAFPASGAANVSPYTSIIVAAGANDLAGLTLEAGGQIVPLPSILTLGSGVLGSTGATFYRLAVGLSPSTSYVLSMLDNGATRELTRFTTAASYDKAPGQAPVLERLRLWRVRYPVEAIAAGGCVFDEYEGYIDVDYQDGSVPNTPASEIVTVLSLQPKTGSSIQRFVFAGLSHFDGAQIENPLGSALVDVPDGGFPSPAYALWKPTLEPDREYCVTMTLYGRNDNAMPAVISNSVCAPVTNLDARPAGIDAAAPPADAVAPDVAAEVPVAPAQPDAASSPPDTRAPVVDAEPAPTPDAAISQVADATVASRDAPAADAPAASWPKTSSGGCSLAGGGLPVDLVSLWLALLALRPSKRRRVRASDP